MKTIAQQLNVKEFPFIIRDSKGNEIYFESSGGFWYKNEFDSNGNQIYYENSNGYWAKMEYNSRGNRIYYENSDGTTYDNRNIPEYTMKNEEKVIFDQLSQEVAKLVNQVSELGKIFKK